MLLARRFTLNPVLIILSLVFWFWMWGVSGTILAVPLLAILKIICDRLRPLKALGHYPRRVTTLLPFDFSTFRSNGNARNGKLVTDWLGVISQPNLPLAERFEVVRDFRTQANGAYTQPFAIISKFAATKS
jgi:hypothetical protein